MRRRSAVVGLGLALVASAGLSYWMLFPREGGRRGVEPALDARGSVEERGPAEVDALVVEPHAPAPPVVGVPELAADGASSARATVSERSAVEAAAPARGFEIRVIDEREKPVPGATVWYQPLGRTLRGKVKRFPRADSVTLADVEELAFVRTDSAGLATLPESAGDAAHAFASDGERWGHAPIQRESPAPRLLQVWPDESLLVRVLDESGAVYAGVGVELGPSWGGGDSLETGADGTVRFTGIRKKVAAHADTKWEVRASVLADPPARVVFDPAAPPPEVTFVVPSTGAVEVRVLDEFGGPARLASCQLSVGKPGSSRHAWIEENRFLLNAQAPGSLALFPRVALGLELELHASGHEFVATRRFVVGPTRAGETVSCEIRLGEDHPVLVFRAVDTAGALIRNETVEIETPSTSGFELRTDGQGQALVHVEGGERTTVELKRRSTGDLAEIEAAPDLAPGLHDIGTVVFGGGAKLVAGIVVDERGNPLQAELCAGKRVRRDLVQRPEELGRSNKDGRFDFRGKEKLDGNLELAAFMPGRAGPAIPFQRGDTGVRVVLYAEGAIEGRVIPLPGMSANELRLVVAEPSQGRFRGASVQTSKNSFGTMLEEGGTFRIGELVPGEYTLHVVEMGGSREFAAVTGLVVQSGETTRDPRLDPLDFAGDYTHRLVLRAEDQEMLKGTIYYGAAGAAQLASEVGFFGHGTCAIVLTGSDARIDIEVVASGFRVERRNGVSGETEVRLQRGFPVRLVLNVEAELPAPPWSIQAALVPTRLEGFRGYPFSAPGFDPRGEAVVLAMEPGPMLVQWWAGQEGSGYRGIDLGREVIVDVHDVEGEQRFEIALTPDELAKLVKD